MNVSLVLLLPAAISFLAELPAPLANAGWPFLVNRQAAPYAFFVVVSALLLEYPFVRLATGRGVRGSILCLVAANLASALAGFLLLLTCPGGALGGQWVMIAAEGMSWGSEPEASAFVWGTAALILVANVAIESAVILKAFQPPSATDRGRCVRLILVANLASLFLPLLLGSAARDLGRGWLVPR